MFIVSKRVRCCLSVYVFRKPCRWRTGKIAQTVEAFEDARAFRDKHRPQFLSSRLETAIWELQLKGGKAHKPIQQVKRNHGCTSAELFVGPCVFSFPQKPRRLESLSEVFAKDRWASKKVSSDLWMHSASSHGRVDHSRAPPGGRCSTALYYDRKVRNGKSM